MKYVVVGADRETGEDVELTFEADSDADARSKAARRGVLVSTCVPATSPGTAAALYRRLPNVLDRLVAPPLRTSRNGLLLGAVAGIGAIAISFGLVFAFFGTLLAVLGVAADRPAGLVTAIVGFVLLLLAVPNAYFAHRRLKALQAGQVDDVPTERAEALVPPALPATRPMPWRLLGRVLLPAVVVLGMIGLGYAYYQRAMHPPLPRIVVNGNGEGLVSITDWRMDAGRWLFATVRYKGDAGVELSYRVQERDVVRATGMIDPPTSGTFITTHDPLEVRIMLPEPPTAETSVEITVTGA